MVSIVNVYPAMFIDETKPVEEQLKEQINMILKDPIKRVESKTDEVASRYQAEGYASLLDREYEKTIRMCTRGLQKAFPFTELSAQLYMTRAKAFKELKLYEESKLDIVRAIERIPRIKFIHVLNEETLRLRNISIPPFTRTHNCNHFGEIPMLSHQDSTHIPGLNEAIQLVYNPTIKRRFFKAVKSIATGDIILIDKAQVSQLAADAFHDANACHYCFKYYKALIPCDHCSLVAYCSEECRQKAFNEYHQMECNLGDVSFSVQCVIKLLLKVTDNGAKLKEAIEYCEDLETIDEESRREFYNLSTLSTNSLASILNLSISMEKDEKEFMRNIPSSVAIAALLLNEDTFAPGNSNVLGLTKLLYRLCYIRDAHHFLDDISCIDRVHITTENIFSLLSVISHSCCANTIHMIYKDNVIVLHAAKDIKPGDEITFNYLPKRMRYAAYVDRKIALKSLKCITCTCEACLQNYDFQFEFERELNVPKRLQQNLQKDHIDVYNLWQLLKLTNNHIRRPCVEVEVIKSAISDAYRGIERPELRSLLKYIGIL